MRDCSDDRYTFHLTWPTDANGSHAESGQCLPIVELIRIIGQMIFFGIVLGLAFGYALVLVLRRCLTMTRRHCVSARPHPSARSSLHSSSCRARTLPPPFLP